MAYKKITHNVFEICEIIVNINNVTIIYFKHDAIPLREYIKFMNDNK